MTKEEHLKLIKYHWHLYIARGGFNKPKMHVGKLEKGGLNHWANFLNLGRAYTQAYPKERYLIEGFVPPAIVKLLVGE